MKYMHVLLMALCRVERFWNINLILLRGPDVTFVTLSSDILHTAGPKGTEVLEGIGDNSRDKRVWGTLTCRHLA